MESCKNVITQLQKDILSLQGFKVLPADNNINIGFRPIQDAFPNSIFPTGCIHEFLSESSANMASTNGFIAGLMSKLMYPAGAGIWISASRTLFPAALKFFGVDPDQILFVDLKKEKDVLYTIEEALKCNRLTSVVGEIKEITFKESRRLQLASEQSRVTGFLLRNQPRIVNTIA